MTRLPRSLDDLRGLRAARWIRESTAGQFDRFGPDAQRDEQDLAIARWGLADVHVSWQVAHSGRTVAATAEWAEMLARAGRDYDVLVVGYVSRFARDLRSAVNARHDLHLAGAAILFADEGVLSSDEDAWEAWAREAVEAEAYSRRLGRSVKKGLAAKFRTLADQAGNPPIGFHRVPREHRGRQVWVLEPDPATIGRVVDVFERYAAGDVSQAELATDTGFTEEQLRKALSNPLYTGVVRRHRGDHQETAAATWPAPVSIDLWERVADVRRRRLRGGGPRRLDRPDLLRGLVYCECGQRIRADGLMGTPPRRRRLHPGRCDLWGSQASYAADVWEDHVVAQISAFRLDAATIERVVRVLSATEFPRGNVTGPSPIGPTRLRLERQKRELALEHAAGRLTDDDYLARMAELRAALATSSETAAPALDPGLAVERLQAFATMWGRATPEMRTDLIRGVYSEIRVSGRAITRAVPTAAAIEIGLDQALGEHGKWVLASPAGVAPSRTRSGGWSVPIEGRRERALAARRSA